MAVINKPAQPLIAPTDVEEVEAIAGAAAADAIAADTTHAPLVNDLVPAAHLPSYVDDVLEFETLDSFPAEGEAGKIYVALDTNNTYRWADTTYVRVGGSEIDLTPYALKTEVAVALDRIADEVDNKQDKPHHILLSAPTTTEPTENGMHMAGSLTADQIAEAREYYPNITVGLDEDASIMFPTNVSTDGEGRLLSVAWNRVLYDVAFEPSKKVLGYVDIEFDLENATYDMFTETIPSEVAKPYKLIISAQSGSTQPIDPSDPEKGVIINGSLTEEQIFNVRTYWPNVRVFLNDEDQAPFILQSAVYNKKDVINIIHYRTMMCQYNDRDNAMQSTVGALDLDLTLATYNLVITPIASAAAGVPIIAFDTWDTSGTFNADQLAIVQANTNVIIDIASLAEDGRGPSMIYRSYYCTSNTMQAIANDPNEPKLLTINRQTGAWTVTAASAPSGDDTSILPIVTLIPNYEVDSDDVIPSHITANLAAIYDDQSESPEYWNPLADYETNHYIYDTLAVKGCCKYHLDNYECSIFDIWGPVTIYYGRREKGR